MSVTLGEFLLAAENRFTEAEAGAAPGPRDHEALAVQARRMVTVLGRYLDTILDGGAAAGNIPDVWQQTKEIRASLGEAGSFLDRAIAPTRSSAHAPGNFDDPVAARYTRAVNALSAGSELLRTHLATGPSGQPEPRSDWAQLLTTRPVIAALGEEVAKWGTRAGHLTTRLAQAPDHDHRLSRPDLARARDKLAAIRLGDLDDDTSLRPAERRQLLLAIPAMIPPERAAPTGAESDEQLCAGISVSAQRLKAAAFAVSREPGNSIALSGGAWRQEAHASAVICDLAARTLQSLADQPPAQIPAIQLLDAASCLISAREAWRHVAWMWRAMSTDTTNPVSRTAVEESDLAVRLGRLLTGKPDWKPTRDNNTVPSRSGRSLAPGDPSLAAIVGAVHEAADAITRTGRADMTALLAVQRAGRLYMAVEAVGEMSSRNRYIAAPGDRVHMLKNAYHLCTDATWQAARRLDALALDTGAPSGTLALIRAALPAGDHVTDPETGFELDPDVFTGQLELFTRLKGTMGRPSSQVDPDALIRAYEDERFTLEECAQRFAISASRVAAILTEHGYKPHHRPRRKEQPAESPPRIRDLAPDERSPLYHQLREIGVTDPGLLLRASTIDKATADVLRGASQELRTTTGTRRKTLSPAQLAAMDGPSDAIQAVRRAAASEGVWFELFTPYALVSATPCLGGFAGYAPGEVIDGGDVDHGFGT